MNNDAKWWKEAVVYQIYPKSFKDSNGDGIGDLPGIVEKLDYLHELGVDVLWLSPIYKSPNDDNGYDISDYQDIMDDFGTMEDFEHLLSEAHDKGMKIIMDLVVNHTSDEHSWFMESRKPQENEYSDFYIWKEGKNGNAPNNWGSWFGGSAWEYDESKKSYYLHIFSKKQPDLNWKNAEVREKIYSMMRWWLDKGVDGFRMDVISLISKTDDFSDGKVDEGIYGDLAPFCINGPHVHEYLKEMNEKVLSRYDIMTVGETTGVTVEEAKKYSGKNEDELNMVFQFEHMELGNGKYGKWNDSPIKLSQLKEIFDKWQNGLADTSWNTLFWSNHDQPRAVSRFGNDGKYWRESAKMLATCLHMMRGTPFIYQGEEIGMTNAGFESLDDYRDIESINAFHELVDELGISKEKMMLYLKKISRDNARTPMQWDASEGAGFTEGNPWININCNYHVINAQKQINDEDSIFNYYRKLIKLRHEKPAIVYGKFQMLIKESEELFVYERSYEETVLTVICNFTDKNIPCELLREREDVLISNYSNRAVKELRPYEAIVYERKCR